MSKIQILAVLINIFNLILITFQINNYIVSVI